MREHRKPTPQQMRDWLAEVVQSGKPPPSIVETVKELWPDMTRGAIF